MAAKKKLVWDALTRWERAKLVIRTSFAEYVDDIVQIRWDWLTASERAELSKLDWTEALLNLEHKRNVTMAEELGEE
jgi:hypothetical protein